ncbi:MAG: phage/plasmid primase, P4 family [Algoriphagus sp.]|uniref:DNA primase family protein n=1 Tax=Algoriphagus sp. TaxID=1872435 RepID=UPI00260A2FBB|nr:phage/plasmid primase, P4 family [Algoriphagus sp.]MDG1276933.1 phage/plasmid primase, P4 family [Algoriphagus sp.]
MQASKHLDGQQPFLSADKKLNPFRENKVIKIDPQFEDLQKPETFINHVLELTKTTAPPHAEILGQLLEQFEPLDFEAMANPHNAENFKLNNKHYTVLSIENVLQIAEKNRWGLCKNHDFIYLFNGTFWDVLDKETFQKFLGIAAEKISVPEITAKYHRFRKELYEQFLATAYLEPKPTLADKVLINLQNGTFEVSPNGTQLRPFDRSDFLTYQLPFEYNPQAKAPLFETYLNKVLPDGERQKVLAEYLGFVFIKHGSNRLKEEKALVLYGTGANGKSVFFEIVSALLGSENTSNYSLQSLTNDNGYFRAKLANKLVNYASEINGKLESSIFKQLVSGEPVEARLPYGEPFTLKQYAKLIFNCNELPKDVEHTNAYFRRFLIIPFDVTIPPQEQDKQLHTKIIEKELSGVFNWVLDGLNRLLKQKRFTDCEAVKQAVEQYKSQSDSVKMFIDENEYQNSPTDYRLIKELYTEYRGYCIEDGFHPVNKSNFIKRLSGFGVLVDRLNVGNVAYLSNGKRPF